MKIKLPIGENSRGAVVIYGTYDKRTEFAEFHETDSAYFINILEKTSLSDVFFMTYKEFKLEYPKSISCRCRQKDVKRIK